jgi:two-component system OmpR family response regulator
MEPKESLLVVDDDPRLCRLLARILSADGFEITTASSGTEMLQRLETTRFDLLLLDRMLPDGDSLLLAQRLRDKSTMPIIMLTGKSDPLDRVLGLEVGADDYITKPFDERELLARVRSVLRRVHTPAPHQSSTIFFAGWELQSDTHTLTAPNGTSTPLSDHELRLLTLFIDHPQLPLSGLTFLEDVMERQGSEEDRSVDVLVSKLRRKLKTDPKQPDLIQSVRGTGYRLCASVAMR